MSFERRREKILIVEDFFDIRQLLRAWLQVHGFPVIEASDGMAGVELARDEAPDLILMDLNLPVLSGLEAVAMIRSLSSLQHTPILAITAYATSEVRQQALAAGCNEILSKPIDREHLSGLIESLLNKARL